ADDDSSLLLVPHGARIVGDAAPLPQALGRWQSIPADASVRSMTERVDAAAAGAQAPAWIAGGGLLVIGIAVTVLLVAIAHSGGNWRGGGHRDGRKFVLEATDAERLAVLSARVAPFAADGHPRVDFNLHSSDALPVELVFVWRTEERPNRNFSKRLSWTGTHIAPLELGPDDGWTGTITALALVAR